MKLVLVEASNTTFRYLTGRFLIVDGMLSCSWYFQYFETLLTTGQLKVSQAKIILQLWEKKRILLDLQQCQGI